MQLEFSRQIFEKYSKSNFMKIPPPSGTLLAPYRRTDKRDEANGRFSQFSERT